MHPQRRLAAISIVVAIAITFVPMPAVGETPATPVTRVSVDGQPLASQLRRMLDGLQSMGQPPRAEDRDRLMAAIKQADSLGLQRATDPLVVAVVTISPEERVSVVRGPSSLKIQQHGFTPAIVKVINQSASTSRLRVKSPQSGPVYAGSEAFSLERQKQAWLGKDQNKNQSTERFLQLAVHSKQPMTDRLSGLGVEYVLLVLSASQSGRREAVMHFDIGDDTADLEFRTLSLITKFP